MDEEYQLIHDYLDEEIDGDQLARLEHWLGASRANRRRFVSVSYLHRQLKDMTVGEGNQQALVSSATRSNPAPRPRRKYWHWSIQLALVMLVTLTVWVAYPGVKHTFFQDDTPTFGQLTGTIDCRWAQDQKLTSDGRLRTGDRLEIESGLIEVTFDAGARVVFKGPAVLEVVNDRRVKVLRGKLWAVVPESSLGFTVETPSAQVVDLGTEFGVDVKNERLSEAYVFRGRIEAGLVDDAGRVIQGVVLGKDEARMLHVRDQRIRPVRSAPYLFARQLDRAELQRPVLHEELEGSAVFPVTEFNRSNSQRETESSDRAEYDLRITTAGDYRLWYYGTGPESLSETIDFEMSTVGGYQTPKETVLPLKKTTHINPQHRNDKRWIAVPWTRSEVSVPLAEGEYRLDIFGRVKAGEIDHIALRLASLPPPSSAPGSE